MYKLAVIKIIRYTVNRYCNVSLDKIGCMGVEKDKSYKKDKLWDKKIRQPEKAYSA